MPPQTQAQRPQAIAQATAVSDDELSKILDTILDQKPGSRSRVISDGLEKRIAMVEEVLPDQLKGQAPRFVKRAVLTFNRKKELAECTPASFIRCVIEAAEVGLAIDGKLAHAVKFNNKVKGDKSKNEQDTWVHEAQLMLDYKGLIAVARRSDQIVDAYGDVICDNDFFEHGRSGDKSRLEHSYDAKQPRGKVYAAYCIIKLPGGDWRYELMQKDELERIRQKSKAKDSGPWVSDTAQMQVKTVLRRGLKLYCDDPAFTRALEIDEREYEGERDYGGQGAASNGKRVTRTELTPTIRSGGAPTSAYEVPTAPEEREYVHREPPEESKSNGNGGEQRMAPGEIPLDTPDPPEESEALSSLRRELAECQGVKRLESIGNAYLGETTPLANEAEVETAAALIEEKRKTFEKPGTQKQRELAP
jgi:recombination protein RecT